MSSHHTDGTAGPCIPRQSSESSSQRLYTSKDARHGCQLGLRRVVCMLRTKACARPWGISYQRLQSLTQPMDDITKSLISNQLLKVAQDRGGRMALLENATEKLPSPHCKALHWHAAQEGNHAPVLFTMTARLRGGQTASACF